MKLNWGVVWWITWMRWWLTYLFFLQDEFVVGDHIIEMQIAHKWFMQPFSCPIVVKWRWNVHSRAGPPLLLSFSLHSNDHFLHSSTPQIVCLPDSNCGQNHPSSCSNEWPSNFPDAAYACCWQLGPFCFTNLSIVSANQTSWGLHGEALFGCPPDRD